MKKIIMMLVTMSMILSLMACGNSKETGSSAVESNPIQSKSEEFGEELAKETGSSTEESNPLPSESEEFGKEFTYLHDKWDLYKATQLSETTFKIENWGRFNAGEGGDPFNHDYDVCVISTTDTSTDFKWLDDMHTAFSITLHDKENSYWKEKCLVTFTVSSTE